MRLKAMLYMSMAFLMTKILTGTICFLLVEMRYLTDNYKIDV